MSSLPWAIIGDFNDLLSHADKKRLANHLEWCLRGFRETISACGLFDLLMSGYPFTYILHRGKPNEV